MKHLLRPIARRLRARCPGFALSLRPLGDLEKAAGGADVWRSHGPDPRFACEGVGFPLKAGWYELSIELQCSDGHRLEPVLYCDYGQGMHESWSLYLNFVCAGRLRHRGVVLLPCDVRQLRLDPAQLPCVFRADGLRLRRIGRGTAAWRMWRSVRSGVNVLGGDVHVLRGEALRRLTSSSGRRVFAEWLRDCYVRRGSRETSDEHWLQLCRDESTSRSDEDAPEKKQRFASQATFTEERRGGLLESDSARNPSFVPTDGFSARAFRDPARHLVAEGSVTDDGVRGLDLIPPSSEMLCIGHSHLACVEQAARDVGFPLQALNFWDMPDSVEKVGDESRLSSALQEQLRKHAGPVFSLIGGGVYGVLGTLVHPRRFDFVLPQEPQLQLDPAAELLPALAVRRVMESLLAEYLSLMMQVRELCNGAMFHIEPPPPYADSERMRADMIWDMFPGMLREISPAALRYKLWKLHSEIIAEWCRGADVHFVPCPPDTMGANGFLREIYYGDGAHANLAYGERVLAQIRTLA